MEDRTENDWDIHLIGSCCDCDFDRGSKAEQLEDNIWDDDTAVGVVEVAQDWGSVLQALETRTELAIAVAEGTSNLSTNHARALRLSVWAE